MAKDVIYIDSDDEIAAVTSKVSSSKESVVALVLPKRCPLLQSSVNMKILNRAATASSKQIVLVTSEPGVLKLAGLAGVFVANTLQSKPFVPEVQKTAPQESHIEEISEESVPENVDEEKNTQQSQPTDSDNSKTAQPRASKADTKKKDSKKKNSKLKVPNFDSFRTRLFVIGGGIFALIIIFILAFYVLPKAKITIISETQSVKVATDIEASPKATSDNVESKEFILKTSTIDKSDSKKTPSTGQRNDGTKANGKITVYNCDFKDGFTIPAGSTFTTGFSGGTASFVTSDAVIVPGFTSSSASACKLTSPYSGSGKAVASVTAVNPGSQYNLSSNRTYTVPGISDVNDVVAVGDAMGGGQDKITKIVSPEDCDKAKNDVQSAISGGDYQKQLTAEFEKKGIFPSIDTFSAKTVSVSCSPQPGNPGEEVTATAKMQFTMSGVDSKALGQLVESSALAQTGPNQTVVNDGLKDATLILKQTKSDGSVIFSLDTTAEVAVKQDPEAIASQVKGKNARQTSEIIKSINGVKDVKVDYSPFWVSKTPSNTKKIQITFVNESNN
jgi:hypothetical protein